MGVREDHLASEADAWARLLDRYTRLTPEQRTRAGVVPGWSAQDLIWHCAYWAGDVAPYLPALMDGSFVDPFEADETLGDRMNAQIAEESQAMERSLGARGFVIAAWSSLADEPTPAAAHWFAEQSFVHYDEHAVEIERFAASLGGG